MAEEALQPVDSGVQLSNLEEVKGKERVSMLQRVREGLLSDQRVHFAGEILHSPYGQGWLETVDIIVAPTKPPLTIR